LIRESMGCLGSKEQSASVEGGRGADVSVGASQAVASANAAASQVPHGSVRRALLNHAKHA
jgi:hypothetical protein